MLESFFAIKIAKLIAGIIGGGLSAAAAAKAQAAKKAADRAQWIALAALFLAATALALHFF